MNASRTVMLCTLAALTISQSLHAHDTWLQTNTNVVRTGDVVHVDLMLGNHGNIHRDFKLASKVGLDDCEISLYSPNGQREDLRGRIVDNGLTARDGFWTVKCNTAAPGLYLAVQTLDRVFDHGKKVRSIKSAKTFFVASDSLDKVPAANPGFDRVLRHPLELVPTTNPVTPMGPGVPISVKLWFKGQPLANTTISFIPRGVELSQSFDARFERKTNGEGVATFTPEEGNYYLVVAHVDAEDEKSDDYAETHYSATLTVYVPQRCTGCE